ncbi:hypothetical protein [Photobacterium sp. TY1-4]|uniref:hypothetical protein n=1 Tax=Photobacterium sp. TY1-4 TaxID=2899122 RepID=UPI0021BFF7B8|nr:hypothetical protein [Photobacterium sp. TY1-4]UXI04660.1 hypothetical protein NH461_25430 [Photobacterium sp. TY1-4]
MSMRDRIKKSVNRTNEKFSDREAQLLLNTSLDLKKLSPSLQNHPLYPELVQVISSATANNWNVAKFESEVKSLGLEAWQLAKDIVDAVK